MTSLSIPEHNTNLKQTSLLSNSKLCLLSSRDCTNILLINKNSENLSSCHESINKFEDIQNKMSITISGEHLRHQHLIDNNIIQHSGGHSSRRCYSLIDSCNDTVTPINLLAQKHLLIDVFANALHNSAVIQDTKKSQLSLNASEYSNNYKPIDTNEKNIRNEAAILASKLRNRRIANDNLSTMISIFYAKFIVVLGIAFPVTDIISMKAPPSFYEGFYLYLYLVSVAFVLFIFITHVRQRQTSAILKSILIKQTTKTTTGTLMENEQKYQHHKQAMNKNNIKIKNQQSYRDCNNGKNDSNECITTTSFIKDVSDDANSADFKYNNNRMKQMNSKNQQQNNEYLINNCNLIKNLEKQYETTSNILGHNGSFYLRIGAIGFGIGSMVYSGLEFGQYFELKKDEQCQNALIILNPAARMLLTILQMQFIFLNSKDLGLNKHKIISKFGLMHLIAMNLCEWLYVLIQETKHEIINMPNNHNIYSSNNNNNNNNNIIEIQLDYLAKQQHQNKIEFHHERFKRATSFEIIVECRRTNIMGNLVQNASPFLFPCTIEYSLICAVTLFEMWKIITRYHHIIHNNNKKTLKLIKNLRKLSTNSIKTISNSSQIKLNNNTKNYMDNDSIYYLSVDCTKAHRGLFGGILISVLTIISLVVYFELTTFNLFINEYVYYRDWGIWEMNLTDLLLFSCGIISTIWAMYLMKDLRNLKCKKKSIDCNLLMVTQSGVFIYSMFSIMGSYFTLNTDENALISLLSEIFAVIQTSIQTMFILNSWWKRCRSSNEMRKKPGKQIVTFLLFINFAIWLINVSIRNHASFRPANLEFFGQWAWAVITHISMPLAIFYRFHSTICLFEIWKKTFKSK